VLFVLVAFGFYGCLKQHTISDIPEISFQSFTQSGSDSAVLTINFQDGEADIGEPTGDTTRNIFLIYYRDTGGLFKRRYLPLQYDSLQFSYCMPYATTGTGSKSITGTIRVTLPGLDTSSAAIGGPYWYPSPGSYFGTTFIPTGYPVDTLIRFNVYIYDRAGHKSNTVSTNLIHIPYSWHRTP